MKVSFISLRINEPTPSNQAASTKLVWEEGKNAEDLHYLVQDNMLCINYKKNAGRGSYSVPVSRVVEMNTASH